MIFPLYSFLDHCVNRAYRTITLCPDSMAPDRPTAGSPCTVPTSAKTGSAAHLPMKGEIMGKIAFPITLALLFLLPGLAIWANEETDVKKAPACGVCGMDREAFGYSRMVIEYDDGSTVGTCSLNCAVAILSADPERKPRSIRVADHDTRELIDARDAVWVIGGRKQGVMTREAKWAFGNKAAAERFIAENGGTTATFAEALKAAREERGSRSGKNPEQHLHAATTRGRTPS